MSDARAERVSRLVEAARQVPADRRGPFLDEQCGNDAGLRREVEALLANHARLSQLPDGTRLRVSSVFHAALGLPREQREHYLQVACADEPDVGREVSELLAFAEDHEFLEDAARPPHDEETRFATPASARTPTSRRTDPFIGRKVREYVVLEKVGEGGMGVVYRALDTTLERHVALKVVRPEYAANADYRRRLGTEAKLAAQLDHQNVAKVFAHFEDEGDLFIVSEFVEGPSLRAVMERGPMRYDEILRVFTAIATGLAAAHAKSIIHRDLKPDNVLLTEEGEPKIVDFGLAKSHQTLIRTTRATVAGTPAYMAPEQTEEHPSRPIDFRADVFSFGVTLYEAITGRNPFEGRSLLTDPPPPTRPGTEIGALAGIVARCLQKRPEDRYGTTKELVDALLDCLPPPPPPPPVPPPPPPIPPLTWWEVHQVVMIAVYAGSLVLLWLVHPLATPLWAARACTFVALTVGAVLVAVRGVLWLRLREARLAPRSPQKRRLLARVRTQFRPWLRGADWAFSLIFVAMAGLMLAINRPGTAAPLLLVAAINAVVFLFVEPSSESDAFPEDDDRAEGPPAPPPTA